MTVPIHDVQAEIRSFGEDLSKGLQGLADDRAKIQFVQSRLPRLLCRTALIVSILKALDNEGSYPDVSRPTLFDNELFLYADSRRLFSLRMYLWGSGEYTVVHDHNSWGVIGPALGEHEVINYRREDDGSVEGYAQLIEMERLLLSPGETAYTLPLNQGIHKTGNPTAETIVTLSVYGKPLPRSYLNGFDVDHCRTFRILPPRRKKRFLAARALQHLESGGDK